MYNHVINQIRSLDITPPIYMYCVFHLIFDRDVYNILSKKFSRYDEVPDGAKNYVQFAS